MQLLSTFGRKPMIEKVQIQALRLEQSPGMKLYQQNFAQLYQVELGQIGYIAVGLSCVWSFVRFYK